MSSPLRYVVCYDVPDDKRRTKLAKFLDSFGDRVQCSVFEAFLDRSPFDNLIEGVRALIDPEQDRVTIYPLCAVCAGKRAELGLAGETPAPRLHRPPRR